MLHARPGADRAAVVLAGALLVIGFGALLVTNAFHPGGNPNDHVGSFSLYARSNGWTADHLAIFGANALTITGLLVVIAAMNLRDGLPALVARIGTVATGVVLALTALRFAVDGVILKRAVDAWANAPDSDKAIRFANAETVRWMEEAVSSYQSVVLGLSLILLGALIVWTARIPRPIGVLLAVGGAGYIVTGWVLGEAGFAPQGALPNMIGQDLTVLAGIYLLISGWRMPASSQRPDGGATRREERYA